MNSKYLYQIPFWIKDLAVTAGRLCRAGLGSFGDGALVRIEPNDSFRSLHSYSIVVIAR